MTLVEKSRARFVLQIGVLLQKKKNCEGGGREIIVIIHRHALFPIPSQSDYKYRGQCHANAFDYDDYQLPCCVHLTLNYRRCAFNIRAAFTLDIIRVIVRIVRDDNNYNSV